MHVTRACIISQARALGETRVREARERELLEAQTDWWWLDNFIRGGWCGAGLSSVITLFIIRRRLSRLYLMAAIAHLARNVDPGEILPLPRQIQQPSSPRASPLESSALDIRAIPSIASRNLCARYATWKEYSRVERRRRRGMPAIGLRKAKALHGDPRPANSAIGLTRTRLTGE